MKAFILAAGLGTRLKPWTEHHPKALVPVGGTPMLERVIIRLKEQGFRHVVINVHHFASQITDFINSRDFGIEIKISDESELLLDTGGALLHAAPMLCADNAPFLIHNVDILSNANLADLMLCHANNDADATLLTSPRTSSRKLLFDSDHRLRGWKNETTDETRGEPGEWPLSQAFSGIHVMSPSLIRDMETKGYSGKFPIMDFYLNHTKETQLRCHICNELELIDIGKPETLARANALFL